MIALLLIMFASDLVQWACLCDSSIWTIVYKSQCLSSCFSSTLLFNLIFCLLPLPNPTPPTCTHTKGSRGSQPHSGLLPYMDALLWQAFRHVFCYRWLPAPRQLNFSSDAHLSNIADHIILTCTHSFILSFKPLLLHNSMALWIQVIDT